MTLEQAIMKRDIPETEKIIKEELQKKPKDIKLWLKLTLIELQYPYEDYESALSCIDNIYTIDICNLTALILEIGIKWHGMGYVDEETFERLNKVMCSNNKERAIVYYLKSLHYQEENDFDNQKEMIGKSIEQYDQYVYPFVDLGKILLSESKYQEANVVFKKAITNVKKIFQPDEVYDFTDTDMYIAEFITGTALSVSNFENLKNFSFK